MTASIANRYLRRLGWEMEVRSVEAIRSQSPLVIVTTHWCTPCLTASSPYTLDGGLYGLLLLLLIHYSHGLDLHILTSMYRCRFLPPCLRFVQVERDSRGVCTGGTVAKLTSSFREGNIRRLVMFGRIRRDNRQEEWGSGLLHVLRATGAGLGFLYLDYDRKQVRFELAPQPPVHLLWPDFAAWMGPCAQRVLCQPSSRVEFTAVFDYERQKLAFVLRRQRRPDVASRSIRAAVVSDLAVAALVLLLAVVVTCCFLARTVQMPQGKKAGVRR